MAVKASSGRGLPAVWERWETFGSEHVNRGFFYCLLPVACTSSHTACTEPNPTHSIPIPLKMFVFKECVTRQHAGSAQLSWVVYRWSKVCVSIFKMGFVQESCFYSCAAVVSLSNSRGGKALDRQVRRGSRNIRICCAERG